MTYEELCATLRKNADVKFEAGMQEYGVEAETMGEKPIPRHVLAKAWVEHIAGEFKGAVPDMCLPDIWAHGVEQLLLAKWVSQPGHTEYRLEFIGAHIERCGYEHYGDAGEAEKYIGALEDKAQNVYRTNWTQCYLLAAYGLNTVEVNLLADWPGTKLYAVNIFEGEGWWGTLFFGLSL